MNIKKIVPQSKQFTIKLVSITCLVLLLLIPKNMIEDLVRERNNYHALVSKEISNAWATDQILVGPFLYLPYEYNGYDVEQKRITKMQSHLILFPEKQSINCHLKTNTKKRNLYEVLLYNTETEFHGVFNMKQLNEVLVKSAAIKWNEAYVAFSTSDPKGINGTVLFQSNSQRMEMKPVLSPVKFLTGDISSNYARDLDSYDMPNVNNSILASQAGSLIYQDSMTFNLSINIKGSHSFFIVPTSKQTDAVMDSDFPHPSFIGNYLPEHDLSEHGFKAVWNILEYNKTLPGLIQFNKNGEINLGKECFGLIVKNPVNNYMQTNRAVKYLILFLIFVFSSIFLTETIKKMRIHIFQYSLVGLALCIFYALLLSISEIIDFDYSYLVSSASIIIMIFMYSLSLFRQMQSSFFLATLLSSFFLYIFIILRLEHYALLFGTIGLFVNLAFTMFVTRKINWYEGEENIVF